MITLHGFHFTLLWFLKIAICQSYSQFVRSYTIVCSTLASLSINKVYKQLSVFLFKEIKHVKLCIL